MSGDCLGEGGGFSLPGGQGPQLFMWCVQTFSSGCPAGRIGDREIVYVPNVGKGWRPLRQVEASEGSGFYLKSGGGLIRGGVRRAGAGRVSRWGKGAK